MLDTLSIICNTTDLQKGIQISKQQAEKNLHTNKDSNPSLAVTNKDKYTTSFFIAGPEKETKRKASARLTEFIHNVFKDVFSGIGCFEGTVSLQVKEGSKPCKVPPRCVAYALQQLFSEELEHL